MKKVTWILAFAVVMCILSSCGQTKNSENTQTNVISRTTEINDDSRVMTLLLQLILIL